MKQPHTDWRLEKPLTDELLAERLPAPLTLRPGMVQRQDIKVLDDFDWHLWQAGLLLLRVNDRELRIHTSGDSCLASCPAATDSRFWWQLPSGRLADILKEHLDVRAFEEKYRCLVARQRLAVLNRDEKIVVRLMLLTLPDTTGEPVSLLAIRALRGYQQEYEQVTAALEVLDPVKIAATDLRQLLLEDGLDVAIPVSKPHFELQPDEPAEQAVTRMAARMLQLARHQEQGIIADTDTEFLHQYRVNIRKVRSLISLFRKSLTAERCQLLKPALKSLGSRTNRLRDLDVFLLDQDYYRSMLPDHLQPGWERLQRKVRRRRMNEQKKIAATLAAEEYLEQISGTLRTLQYAPEFSAPQAEMGIRALVSRKILKQYRQICRDGGAIDERTEDAAVHELRIECKKLRYLLELFSELYAKEQLRQLSKRLKALQDNLGRFNDFAVQQEDLADLSRTGKVTDEELASIHGLTAVLFNKQQQERGLVTANIAAFIAEPVAEEFRLLFQNESPEN